MTYTLTVYAKGQGYNNEQLQLLNTNATLRKELRASINGAVSALYQDDIYRASVNRNVARSALDELVSRLPRVEKAFFDALLKNPDFMGRPIEEARELLPEDKRHLLDIPAFIDKDKISAMMGWYNTIAMLDEKIAKAQKRFSHD